MSDVSSIELYKNKKLLAENSKNAQRRERIATACMPALLSLLDEKSTTLIKDVISSVASWAVFCADSLIIALDEDEKNEE